VSGNTITSQMGGMSAYYRKKQVEQPVGLADFNLQNFQTLPLAKQVPLQLFGAQQQNSRIIREQ